MLSLGLYPASQSKLVSMQAIRHVSYQILSTQCRNALLRKCIQGHACVHSSIILIHMHHHQSINLKPPEPVSLPVYSDLNEQWQIVFCPCKCLLEVSMGVGKLNRSLKADNDSAWVISQHKQYCNISLNCHLECVIKYPKPLYLVNQIKNINMF